MDFKSMVKQENDALTILRSRNIDIVAGFIRLSKEDLNSRRVIDAVSTLTDYLIDGQSSHK